MGVWVDKPPTIDVKGSTAHQLVHERFEATQAFATDSYEATKEFITGLQSLVAELVPPPTADIDGVELPLIPDLDYSGRPRLGNIVVPSDWPENKPIAPTLLPLPGLSDFTFPVMSFSAPVWNNPEKPTAANITAPGNAPSISVLELPPVPELTLPAVPEFGSINLPSAPDVTLPSFNAVLVDESFSLEGASFNWEESPYNSPIWEVLLDKVVDGIRNGGTGLGADVEAEIWDRAQRRQQAENEKLYRETEEYFASRGWTIPPGAMAGRLAEAANEIAKNNTDLNGKIAIEQAELAQKNTQFLVDKGLNLETILRDFFTATVNRSLDAAKAITGSAIDIHKALMDAHTLKIERYKAEAAVFEIRVKAALEAVEIFKAQIEGAKVSSEVQKNLVDIYEKQIAAIETRVRLYTAQMDGVKTAASIEQLKLESFRIEVQAYEARLGGEKVRYDIYGKEVDAEQGKAQVYSEQVRAFVAEVDAVKARNDIQLSHLTAVATQNNLLIDQYKGQLVGYIAEIDTVAKKIDGVVRGFEAEARAYSAETDAESAMYGAKTKEIEARIMQSRLVIEKAVAQIDAATKGYTAIKGLQVEGLKGAANVGAQLSSAAMNAVNASAAFNYGESMSESANYGTSQSLTEQHSYQHE